ncbi:MAG: ABC transporter permease [Candidatus Marinimicrobia bacterium]|nr:ABC transporter permease [Candidatus Neomarinimicrobiota bacterium]
MTPERFIARRYLRAKHEYGFISFIGYLGMLGLALGVAALILTFSIMRGFRNEVERKLASLDGHVRIANVAGSSATLPDSLLAAIARRPEVAGVTPFLARHALGRNGQRSDGMLLLGMEWEQLGAALKIDDYLTAGEVPAAGQRRRIILGAKLAQSLRVVPGDRLHLFDITYLLGKQGLRGGAYTVAGIYRSGMVEYDQQLAFVSLSDAQELFDLPGQPANAIITLTHKDLADAFAARLGDDIGYPYFLTTWGERHANLFAWLSGQQMPILIVFGFIAFVALINILSMLSLVVIEKVRDIGILRSIGFSRLQIRKIFLYQGGMVGLAGSVGGVALAIVLGLLQNRYHFIALDADIYFMDYLPVLWTWQALVGIPLLALLLSLGAAIMPSRKASAILPAEALRYE